MPCKSRVIRDNDKNKKPVGYKLIKCEGTCGPDDPCLGHRLRDPDDDEVILHFCACASELYDNPISRRGMVKSCRIALMRHKTGLKPFDVTCVGFCDDDDNEKECRAVIVKTIQFADGTSQDTLECECVYKTESIT